MKIKTIIAGLLIVLFPASGYAQTAEGNFASYHYPTHSCGTKPIAPVRSPTLSKKWQVQEFNVEVEMYNRRIKEMQQCIATYIKNANNDINTIQQKVQEAADTFNR